MAKRILKVPRAIRSEIGAGIRKLIRGWKRTGIIRTSRATYRPASLKKALAQAAAIEYGRYGIGRAGAGRRKK